MPILINATKSGSSLSISLEDLCTNYYDAVKRFVRYHVQSPELVEDITQETFYKAIRFYPRLRQDASGAQLYTWLVRIATNAISDHYRSPRGREHLELEEVDTLTDERSRDPYECIGESVLDGPILYAWRKLSTKQQRVLALAVQGYKSREIARQLGCAPSEVHVALKIARVAFKQRYQCYQEQEVA